MNINHPNVKSKLYELIKTIEFDVALGDDGFSLRIELFRSTSDSTSFRAHVWRTEFYRIQSTFPQNDITNEPEHLPSDELIMIDDSMHLKGNYSDFQAENEDVAIQLVLDDYKRFLNYVTGQ